MHIIPTPKKAEKRAEPCSFQASVCGGAAFEEAISAFVDYAQKLGVDFERKEGGAICVQADAALAAGAYRLDVQETGITLFAQDITGAHHGFATILQLLQPADEAAFTMPLGYVEDAGDCEYRSLMVDLSRVWRSFDYLLHYVDMCYFYKVATLQLHFTDSQSFTLPSKAYPKLSTKDRHYTFEEIAQLVSYALERGVDLVPELDVPGHSAAFREAYPRLFCHADIIPYQENAIRAVQTLFREICAMFPYSKYIHIGGDEADLSQWTSCEECSAYGKSKGLETAEEWLADFICEMASVVFEEGKTPIVWEGFKPAVNSMISKDIPVMSWENFYQLTPDLLDAGFKVINCSWNPMYIFMPCADRCSLRDSYDWTIYQWTPVHPKSPYIGSTLEIQPTDAVMGGQLLVWSDGILSTYPDDPEKISECIVLENDELIRRLPYLAENTWNIDKRISFEEFSACAENLNERLRQIMN